MPVWHTSVSANDGHRVLNLDELQRPELRALEQHAKDILAGRGRYDLMRWDRATTGHALLHLRRGLTDIELTALTALTATIKPRHVNKS